MVLIGFSDALSLAQSNGDSRNNGPDTLFSMRQIQAPPSDTETRVLKEMDEKIHNVIELILERPPLRNVMDNFEPNSLESEQYLFSYYVPRHS